MPPGFFRFSGDAVADLSLYKFSADLTAFARTLDLNLATIVRKIAFDLFAELTKRTPVDTGRARAGWGVSIDVPDITTVPPEPPEGVTLPAPGLPNLSAVDGTQVVYILNNVVYIEALEDGHSEQAPAGMVRLSLALLELKIESYLEP